MDKYYKVNHINQDHPHPVFAGKYRLVRTGIYEMLAHCETPFDTIPINILFDSKNLKALNLNGTIDENFHQNYSINEL